MKLPTLPSLESLEYFQVVCYHKIGGGWETFQFPDLADASLQFDQMVSGGEFASVELLGWKGSDITTIDDWNEDEQC